MQRQSVLAFSDGRRLEGQFLRSKKEGIAPMILLLIILLLLTVGGLPTWPYSRGWGYYPSSGLGLVLVVLLVLMLLGRL